MNRLFGLFDVLEVHLFTQENLSGDYDSISVSFNGEIYNSQELILNLEKKGYKFRTSTVSELIAYAYKEWGEEFPKQVNGSFSLCIYDKKKNNSYI